MPCSCGHVTCECGEMCGCCPFICQCPVCFEIRRNMGAHCEPCGGLITAYVCSNIPVWRKSGQYPNYPNLDFLRPHPDHPTTAATATTTTTTSTTSSRTSDKKTKKGRSVPEATQCSTAFQRSAPETTRCSSSASQGSETSRSPPRDNDDDDLIFPMDDIDFSTEASKNIPTGAKSRGFHGSSHLSSSTNVSGTKPFGNREQPNRLRTFQHHSSDETVEQSLSQCKMPRWSQLENSGMKFRESQNEIPTTMQDVPGSSHHNPRIPEFEHSQVREVPRPFAIADSNRTESIEREMQTTSEGVPGCSYHNPGRIPELEHSQVTEVPRPFAITDSNRTEPIEREMQATSEGVPACSHHNPDPNISEVEPKVTGVPPEHELDATSLKWTESHESEMMTTKDIPGCSYKYVSKGESQTTDGASYVETHSADDYSSESLSSDLVSDDSPPSYFPVSPCTGPFSTSAPSTYDLPERTCNLKSSLQKKSAVLGSSKTSSTSGLSKFENLTISETPIDSRTSSETSSSIETLPDNMPNGARYDEFSGEPGIPTFSAASSQSNNTLIQAESTQPGASQTRSSSNSFKLKNPEVSKSAKLRTPSESDSSIENISGDLDDTSEDEASKKK